MKLPREIGKEVDVIEAVSAFNATILEKTPLVKRNFSNGCLKFEAGIPSSALPTMKPPPERSGMRERGIRDMSLRHSQEQLAGTNSPITTVLRDLSFIRRSVEFAQVREDIWRKWKAFKDALGTKLRWDQPMGSDLVELFESCQSVPASLGVEQTPHLLQSRYSCPYHEIDRHLAAEERIIIRLRHPTVRQIVGQ